jgi:hypothetical protein
MELLFRAVSTPAVDGVRRSRWVIIRSTFAELKSTTIETFKMWLGSYGKFRYDSPIKFTMSADLPDRTKVEAEFLFMPLDGEDSISKLRSLEVTGAWINEGSMIVENFLPELVGRLRYMSGTAPPETWRGIIVDSNMPSVRHWIYTKFEEDRPPSYKLFKQPPALLMQPDGSFLDNPEAENIQYGLKSVGGFKYYHSIVESSTLDRAKVLVLCEYGSVFDGKPVYFGMWSDRDHSANGRLAATFGSTIIVGIDWGMTPAACFTCMSSTGQLQVLDELAPQDVTLDVFINEYIAPLVATKYRGCNLLFVGDPAGAQRNSLSVKTAFEVMRASGFAAIPAITNDPIARRDAVAHFLMRRNAFLIDPGCLTIREGFNGGYKFARSHSSKEFKQVPEKNLFSHIHDGLQYAALYYYKSTLTGNKPKKEPKPPKRFTYA